MTLFNDARISRYAARLWQALSISMMCITIVGGVQQHQKVVISPQGDIEMASDLALQKDASSSLSYGADVSFPMQHAHVLPDENPLGDSVQDLYTTYIDGCRRRQREQLQLLQYYDKDVTDDDDDDDLCLMYESDRIEMNLLQPPTMENYTDVGYAKVKTPPILKQMIQKFWKANRGHEVEEKWSPGNTYVNHWDAPTKMLDVGRNDVPLPFTNQERLKFVQQVQSVLEQWTKQSLVFTSLYGIRIYEKGSILAPHVDRLPLVSSAIIHVAHGNDEGDEESSDTEEEPWILEVIGHDGKAKNVTMEDDDMLLYESHSIIHGRPFPLQGSYYANIFVHFEPYGHSARHASKDGYGSAIEKEEETKSAYEAALKRDQEKQKRQNERKKEKRSSPKPAQAAKNIPGPVLPPYIHPSEAVKWNQEYYFERDPKIGPKPTKAALGTLNVHIAAADGDLEGLKEVAKENRSLLFKADHNGWRPIHEAARSGQRKVLEYLIEEGAQINERTNQGSGGTALWWAEKKPKANKASIELLKKHGAVSVAPGFAKEKGEGSDD